MGCTSGICIPGMSTLFLTHSLSLRGTLSNIILLESSIYNLTVRLGFQMMLANHKITLLKYSELTDALPLVDRCDSYT